MDGTVQKSQIFWKILEIAEDHNFGTEYARNVKLGHNVQFWILYCIPLIIQFWLKVGLDPFGTELFLW